MGNESSGSPGSGPRSLLAGRRVWAVVIAALAITAGFGAYYYVAATTSSCQSGPHTLVVETYDTFFDSGPDPAAARATVFGGFENATHSHVCVEYVSGDLATTLLTASGPRPDVVVGLDELTASRVEAAGLLVPYAPPELADVSPALVSELSPDDAAVPYEYGFIGLDYNVTYDDSHGHPFSTGNFLANIEDNRSLAEQFLYEVPPDITGEEFLALEIAFSTEILHTNWTDFWRTVGAVAPSTTDWGTGFGEFSEGEYASFVSYTTDPAYDAYFGPVGALNTSVLRYGGENYSWESIYGTGIVRAAGLNLTLAQDFENWLLSGPVQSLIPTNEWEYPSNETIPLPDAFDWSVAPSSIVALNSFQPVNVTAADLPGWILQWQSAVSG